MVELAVDVAVGDVLVTLVEMLVVTLPLGEAGYIYLYIYINT